MDRTDQDRACEGCGTTVAVAWSHGGYVCPSCKADYQKWLAIKGKA